MKWKYSECIDSEEHLVDGINVCKPYCDVNGVVLPFKCSLYCELPESSRRSMIIQILRITLVLYLMVQILLKKNNHDYNLWNK